MVEGEDGLRGVLSQLMTSTHLNHLPNEAVLMVWSAQSQGDGSNDRPRTRCAKSAPLIHSWNVPFKEPTTDYITKNTQAIILHELIDSSRYDTISATSCPVFIHDVFHSFADIIFHSFSSLPPISFFTP